MTGGGGMITLLENHLCSPEGFFNIHSTLLEKGYPWQGGGGGGMITLLGSHGVGRVGPR